MRGQCACINTASAIEDPLSSFQSVMAASSSTPCGPLIDTKTYTYSDLDNGFTPPTSCLEHTYASSPDGYDYYSSSTKGTKTKVYISLDVYRGRNPDCFPTNYPAACSYTGVIEQPLIQPYNDIPMESSQAITEITGLTWSETHYVYSPATCPGEYIYVRTQLDGSIPDVTTATCCPV
jgi:hypothetical protein